MSGPSIARRRALSPAVGTVLFVGIVLLLGTLAAGMVFELAETQEPAPDVALELAPAGTTGTYELVHHSGDRLDGDRLRVRGVTADSLDGTDLVAGRSVTVDPYRETVRVVWVSADGDTSYPLAAFDVLDRSSTGSIGGFGATVFTGSPSGIRQIEGDGEPVTTVPGSSDAAAIGEAADDVTGNGKLDVPYVTGSGEVEVVDPDGAVTTLATSSDISGSVEADKTRLATGSWNGSDTSVFFVDQNHDAIYRVAPGGTPVEVATPGNGAQGVVGVGDVDDDGTEELVFGDASQQLRYLEPNGTSHNVEDGQTGSNNGIGTGSLVDLDGDGVPAIVAVDTSNDLKINREPSGGGTANITLGDAAKAPPTAADVDGDGALELVYVSTSDTVQYVDDPEGANAVETLTNETGADVDGSDETGVT